MWTQVVTRPDEKIEEFKLHDLAIGTSMEDQRRIEALGAELVRLDDARHEARRTWNKPEADRLGLRIARLRARIINILNNE